MAQRPQLMLIAGRSLAAACIALLPLAAGGASAADSDQNGIEDERELPLARRFAPTLALHAPDIERNGIRVPVYPVPVEIMGLAGAEPGAGLRADRLFVLWRQQPLDYPYGDHWVQAAGWSPPLPESDPGHDYSALGDDPIVRQVAPPAMPFGPYALRFHWEYGNPAVNEPAEWYAVWESGNEWTRPGADFPPTAYAHLRRCEDAGCAPGAVLIQYWFFFPFNDWINNHEGDWEGMNVIVSSDDPDAATVLDVEYFAHRVHIVRPAGMSLGEHCLITDETHPVAFVGGHGRLTGCIGGTGEGEASHGFYPTSGRYSRVSEGDPLGCFELADEEVAISAGPTVHWSDLAIEVIPDPGAIDTQAHPERAWLAADVRFGTRRVPSVGGALWHDVGNYAPRGPAYNPERRFGRVAAATDTRPYSASGAERPYAASEIGWVPFACFLAPFTGMTGREPGSLAEWTLGTGTWTLAGGGLVGRGDGALRASHRAFFTSPWPPAWYALPFVAWNGRAARFGADLALLAPLADGSAAGLAVAGAAGCGEAPGQVRIVLRRASPGHAIEVRLQHPVGDSLLAAAPIADPGSAAHRLEVLTLAADAGVLFHDVWLDGALVLGSIATPGAREAERGLVADGDAHVLFDRVALSGLRIEPAYRHPPFAAITFPASGADIYSCQQLITWIAADEKSEAGIAWQRLALSTDGGASFDEIAVLGGTARSFDWLPPAVAHDREAVLALAVTDLEGDVRTVRSGTFRLRSGDPPATVRAPAGGEVWMRGSTHDVRWSAPCRPAVDLALSTDGGASFDLPIAAGVANSGALAWSIPAHLPVGRPCRVRVAAAGWPPGASAADFTLAWDGRLAGGDFEVEAPWTIAIETMAARGAAAVGHGVGDPPLTAPLAGQGSLFAAARAGGLAPREPRGPLPSPAGPAAILPAEPPWPAWARIVLGAESEPLPLADPQAVRALHVSLHAIAVATATPAAPARAAARAAVEAIAVDSAGGELARTEVASIALARDRSGVAEERLDEVVMLPPWPPGAATLRFGIRLEAEASARAEAGAAEAQVMADELRLENAIAVADNHANKPFPTMSLRPHPSGGGVWIEFTLSETGPVSLSAYDVAGRLVERLLAERLLPRGAHSFLWGAHHLPSGAYFLDLRAGSTVATRKWLLVR